MILSGQEWGYIQNAFAFYLCCVFPFMDLPRTQRLKAHTSSLARIEWYRFGFGGLWVTAVLGFLALGKVRLFSALRLASEGGWNLQRGWLFRSAVLLVCAYFALAFYPGLRSLLRSKVRARYGRALRSLRYLLPVSDKERFWFALLSVSAGICEEMLYRGFVFVYLQGQLEGGPHLGLIGAWLLSSVIFGIAHLYQGFPGVLRSTITGLAFGLTAILTGGLAVPMLLHSLVDLQILAMYRPALDAPGEAELLMTGTTPAVKPSKSET